MIEVEMLGICSFCENHNHDFPEDRWHEKKHESGWHSCDVLDGFRFNKPLCPFFKMKSGAVFVAA